MTIDSTISNLISHHSLSDASKFVTISYIPIFLKKEYTGGIWEKLTNSDPSPKNVKEENSLNCSDWAEYWLFVLFRECWRRKNTRGESENGLNCSDWADYQLFEIFQNVEKRIQWGIWKWFELFILGRRAVSRQQRATLSPHIDGTGIHIKVCPYNLIAT